MAMSIAWTNRRWSRARGAIAIEFALVALVLLPLIFGVIDLGRAFYAYDVLAKSVRSASRYLATDDTEDPDRRLGARCIVLTGSAAISGTACLIAKPQLPDLDSADVKIDILTPATNPGVKDISTGPTTGAIDLVTVSVSGYPMSKITVFLFPDLVLGPISSTVPYVNF
jgi:hypothetical protein